MPRNDGVNFIRPMRRSKTRQVENLYLKSRERLLYDDDDDDSESADLASHRPSVTLDIIETERDNRDLLLSLSSYRNSSPFIV